MAKDPAILFYTSDFLSGVMDLDMEERGQYITLLCAQHQKGHLSEKTIRLLVGSVSDLVLSKFKIDEDGLYFNERMDFESVKRTKYSESRKSNRLKKDMINISSTYDKHMYPHMENENENENENSNVNNKKGVGFFEKCLNDEGWKESLMRATGIQTPGEWITKFNDHVTSTEETYPRLADYRRHCTHWVKLELEKIKNGKPKSKQPATIDQVAAAFSTPPVFVNLGDFSNVSRRKDQGSE